MAVIEKEQVNEDEIKKDIVEQHHDYLEEQYPSMNAGIMTPMTFPSSTRD